MGLLGMNDEDTLNLGMGLLQAGATGSNFGGGIAQAYGGMQQAQQERMKAEQAARMNDMQMQNQQMQFQQHQMQVEQAKKAIAENEAAKVQIEQFMATLDPNDPRSAQIKQAYDMKVPLPKIWEHFNPERKAPEGMQYADNGSLSAIPGYVEMKKQIAAAGRNPVQNDSKRGQIIFDNQGRAFNVNPYTNEVKPVAIGGQQISGAQYSPDLQANIAGAKEFGKTTAEDRAKGMTDAPRVIATAEEALRQSNELLKHPGFKQAVGASSMLGIQKIPGTDAKDFMNRLDQIKGGAFLEAFNTLKGGGQITEVEGKKATDAIARMDNSTSETEFNAAVRDYQNVIRNGMNRAKMRAGNNLPAVSTPAPVGAKFLGFE